MSFIRKIKKGNKVYLAEVENVRIDGKVVQRHIRYVGKEADGKTILSSSISDAEIESVKLHGPLLVLNHLSKEIGLSAILGSHGDEILSLVFAHCHDYKSINEMSRWFERTDLNMVLNIDKLTERKLLKALDSIESCNLEELQEKIFKKVQSKYKLSPSGGVVYDVTNTYLYGKKCPLARYGKDKSGIKGRPLVQIGLAVTKDEGVPMFHKSFDGNISDSRTLQDLTTLCKSYDIKSGLFIYDRGITSASNIKEIQALGWDSVCGIKSNEKLKKEVDSLISKGDLVNIKYRVKRNNTIFYVHAKEYKYKEIKGKLLICFNEKKKKDLRESRYDEILAAQELLQKGKKIKPGLECFFTKTFKLKKGEIEKAEKYDGFSFVFSTKRLANKDIIDLYFKDKDIAEKAFQTIKGIVKLRPIRHWLYNRVIAHIFICYLSYLLLSLLRLKLKKLNISPIEALRELDSLYKVYIKDPKKNFRVSKVVALNKKQEEILKTIDKNLLAQCSV
jgi:transposase